MVQYTITDKAKAMREKNYQGNQRFFDSIHKNLLKTTLQL